VFFFGNLREEGVVMLAKVRAGAVLMVEIIIPGRPLG
jgi:hypothetical protein